MPIVRVELKRFNFNGWGRIRWKRFNDARIRGSFAGKTILVTGGGRWLHWIGAVPEDRSLDL